MGQLQPHRCRWLRWEPPLRDRKKGEIPQKMMCWQRGKRIRERECLPCLLAIGISRHDSHFCITSKSPQFEVKRARS